MNGQALSSNTTQNTFLYHSPQYPLLCMPPTPILRPIDLPHWHENPLVDIIGYNPFLLSAELSVGTRGLDANDPQMWELCPGINYRSLVGLSIELGHGEWKPEDGYKSILSIFNRIRYLNRLKNFRLVVSRSQIPGINTYAYHHVLLELSNLTTITIKGCVVPVSDCLRILSWSSKVVSFEVDSLQDVDSTLNPAAFPVPSGVSLLGLKTLAVSSSINPKLLWERLFMPNLSTVFLAIDFEGGQNFDPHNGVYKWDDYEEVTIKGMITVDAFQHLGKVCTKPGQLRVLSHDIYAY